MARDLGDVLHYFLPEAPVQTAGTLQREPEGAAQREPAAATRREATRREPAEAGGCSEPRVQPLVCTPVGSRDVVRRALLWNLAVELARQGARTSLLAPPAGGCAPWPAPGRGPLGVEVRELPGDGLPALAQRAEAVDCHALPPGGPALTLAAVPIAWLRSDEAGGAPLRWVLLLARPEERELLETWAALEAIATRAPEARIGACVFGVRTLADARRAFEGLAALAEIELSRSLVSYGVLIDDVHLSRSIVSQRPIPLAQPASPAARALADVASLLLEDAGAASPDPRP